jgi:hypothetical protein
MSDSIKLNGLKVSVNQLNNFSQARKMKLIRSARLLEEVVNSLVFTEEFLKLDLGVPGAKLLERFMSGGDQYGEADGDIDIDLTFYYRWWSKVVGYITQGGEQYINGKFFDRYNEAEIAGNLAHEYFHRMGYSDDAGEMSIPYQVGYLVEEIGNNILFRKGFVVDSSLASYGD